MRPNDREEKIVVKNISANRHFSSKKIFSNLAKFHGDIVISSSNLFFCQFVQGKQS